MKKIIFDIRELEKGKHSGIGRFILGILKNSEFFKDYEFIVAVNNKTDFENPYLKKFHKIIIDESIPVISEQISLYKYIKKTKSDIFFSPYYKYPIMVDIPIITSIFDITYLKLDCYKKIFKNNFYIKNFIRLFSSKTDLIITLSENTKKDILSIFKIPDYKIKVIYPYIEDFFPVYDNEILKKVLDKFDITGDYILYVGNNLPHKNVKTLYNAYLYLPDNIKNQYKLLFVGFEDLKGEYPMGKIIKSVNDDELKVIYTGCSLFVFPSFYEGFGYPPLEALMCGARVLSSDTSSLREILKDNVYYFNPYDIKELTSKIETILGEKKKKNKLDFTEYSKTSFLINIYNLFKSL